MSETTEALRVWRGRCEAAGTSGIVGTVLEPDRPLTADDLEAFRDSAGQRNSADSALIARLRGTRWTPALSGSSPPDAKLWHAVLCGAGSEPLEFSDEPGPLWPSLVREGIEAWTLAELRGLHALWWLGIDRPPLRARALSAAAWHVRELQPDNATNRPWAIHVFAVLAAEQGDTGAEMHAQTMLHNAMITGAGRPEVVSAAILLDAVDALAIELESAG